MSKKNKTFEELLEEALVPEDGQPYEVPTNWVWTRVQSLGEVVTGSTPSKSNPEYYGSICPLFKPTDLNQGFNVIEANEYLSELGFLKTRPIPEGSIMVTCIGATIGKTGFSRKKEAATNQQINTIVVNPNLVPEFIYFGVISSFFQNSIIENSSSTTLPIINKGRFEKLSFPLPPYNEQKRIADKVKRLLGKIEEAKQLIEEAKGAFELRREAILDKAFRGELTKKWRESSFSITPIEETLEATEVVNNNAKNKNIKFSELNEVPFAIPDSWKWIKLHQICLSLKNGLYKPASYYAESGTPCLRMYNIDNNELNLKDIHYMTLTDEEIEEYGLKQGDILINRVNSRELVGKCAPVLKGFPTVVFESKNIRIRLHEDISTEYVSGFLNSIYVKKWINESCKQTVGMATINQEFLKNLYIPMPPVEEQKHIMNILNRISENENKIRDTIKLSEKFNELKDSVLSKAFRGELGTNDPSEENAIELLKEVLQEQVK
ncbi:restriction endonuclease subunit S [Bacillus sp. REN10]|uniref:restriction endonuclease subunit S n=1 Tax=Bacillus sp. REN10 TaxID=2782541 RepID=UPI00193C1DDF|nr:restriction endonuclease subunit S [Bacillus sp. REN10]